MLSTAPEPLLISTVYTPWLAVPTDGSTSVALVAPTMFVPLNFH